MQSVAKQKVKTQLMCSALILYQKYKKINNNSMATKKHNARTTTTFF